MKRIVCIFIIVLACVMWTLSFPVSGKVKQKEKEWSGEFKDGIIITKADLKKIFAGHIRWLKTKKKEGQKAVLTGANLSGANLFRVNLSGANLFRANLFRANLSGADLSGTDLIGAKLNKANLNGADLSGAKLSGASLIGAKLMEANLSRANLIEANLTEVYLFRANLIEAYLRGVDLSGADLSGANLSGADLSGANLSGADLSGADLSKADLSKANLSRANLSGANLSRANLMEANLIETVFELKPKVVPEIQYIAFSVNLSELTYLSSPHSLVELREEFKKTGQRRQEREVTHAIKRTHIRRLWNGRILNKLESLFNLIFFELTCTYGMNPGRPLIILMCFIPFFGAIYIVALNTKRQKTGLWVTFSKGRVLKAIGEERPFKITAKFPLRALPTDKLKKNKLIFLCWYRMIRIAIYFSLMTSFSIGWREVNVDNLITRLQRREYTIRATGWVRTVAGLQSLISLYLLVLWGTTFFGRPFESF